MVGLAIKYLFISLVIFTLFIVSFTISILLMGNLTMVGFAIIILPKINLIMVSFCNYFNFWLVLPLLIS